MDKDRIKGVAHEVKGAIKETVGKVTGNRSVELKGKAEKTAGALERKVGETKDAVRKATKT
ncbi:CsbD family protein [Alcaligenes sp. Marseille-Q7550]